MLSAVPHVELLLKERGGKGRQARRGKEDHDLRRSGRTHHSMVNLGIRCCFTNIIDYNIYIYDYMITVIAMGNDPFMYIIVNTFNSTRMITTLWVLLVVNGSWDDDL